MLIKGILGLTIPWALVEVPVAVKCMKTALERGANFWNGVRVTLYQRNKPKKKKRGIAISAGPASRKAKLIRTQGTHYGTPQANSLHLLKHYFETYPEDADEVVLSIKGAFQMKEGPDCSPEGIRASVEDAITVLPPSVKTIDIFQCSRVDPNVPIETSVQALADLVREGKIGGVGLSEANANTIRRAYAVHPIAAVEIEMSLFTTDALRNGIADTCHERKFFRVSTRAKGTKEKRKRKWKSFLPLSFIFES